MVRSLFDASWRFLIVGASVNLALFGLFALLIALNVDYRIAMTMTYALGICLSFYMNRNWSWKAENKVYKSLLWYIGIYLVAYIIYANLMIFLVSKMGITPIVAGIISMCIMIAPQTMLLNKFAFR